jgi:hypothetical protein
MFVQVEKKEALMAAHGGRHAERISTGRENLSRHLPGGGQLLNQTNLIRGGTIVTCKGRRRAAVLCRDRKTVEIAAEGFVLVGQSVFEPIASLVHEHGVSSFKFFVAYKGRLMLSYAELLAGLVRMRPGNRCGLVSFPSSNTSSPCTQTKSMPSGGTKGSE